MRKITTAAVAGVLVVPAATSTAFAGATSTSVIATYDGKTIDLASGWQGAHACVVLTTSDVRCYDTQAEMRDALAAAAQQTVNGGAQVGPLTACGSPTTLVTLYASTNFGGNSLSFTATSGWTNLALFGFDNDMESWVNSTACNAAVADGTNGTGAQLTLTARSSSTGVAANWKNRASSINVLP